MSSASAAPGVRFVNYDNAMASGAVKRSQRPTLSSNDQNPNSSTYLPPVTFINYNDSMASGATKPPHYQEIYKDPIKIIDRLVCSPEQRRELEIIYQHQTRDIKKFKKDDFASQLAASDFLVQMKLDEASRSDSWGTKWTNRWSSTPHGGAEALKRVLYQCRCGIDHIAGTLDKSGNPRKRAITVPYTGCLAHFELVCRNRDGAVVEVSGFFQHNEKCRNSVARELPKSSIRYKRKMQNQEIRNPLLPMAFDSSTEQNGHDPSVSEVDMPVALGQPPPPQPYFIPYANSPPVDPPLPQITSDNSFSETSYNRHRDAVLQVEFLEYANRLLKEDLFPGVQKLEQFSKDVPVEDVQAHQAYSSFRSNLTTLKEKIREIDQKFEEPSPDGGGDAEKDDDQGDTHTSNNNDTTHPPSQAPPRKRAKPPSQPGAPRARRKRPRKDTQPNTGQPLALLSKSLEVNAPPASGSSSPGTASCSK